MHHLNIHDFAEVLYMLVGEKPNFVVSKTASALGRLLRIELVNDENKSFALGGCSLDLVWNLLLACSGGISGVGILWLEAASLGQVVWAPLGNPGLGVFLQPWEQPWGAADRHHELLWLGKAEVWASCPAGRLQKSYPFLNFKISALTLQPQKCFQDIRDV